MSKKLSFRGKIHDGVVERIKLSTLNGKTGYKITKFLVLGNDPADNSVEAVVKIYTKFQTTVTDTFDFTESDLIAAIYNPTSNNINYDGRNIIIFDNAIFNQDIFLTYTDASGATSDPYNYYIELETISLTDIQATQLTLRNIRTISSR